MKKLTSILLGGMMAASAIAQTSASAYMHATDNGQCYWGNIEISNVYDVVLDCAAGSLPDFSKLEAQIRYYDVNIGDYNYIPLGTVADNSDLFIFDHEQVKNAGEGMNRANIECISGVYRGDVLVNLNQNVETFRYNVNTDAEPYSLPESDHDGHELFIVLNDEYSIPKGCTFTDENIVYSLGYRHILNNGGEIMEEIAAYSGIEDEISLCESTRNDYPHFTEDEKFAEVDWNNFDCNTTGSYEVIIKPFKDAYLEYDIDRDGVDESLKFNDEPIVMNVEVVGEVSLDTAACATNATVPSSTNTTAAIVPESSPTVTLRGDANCDKAVNIADATAIVQAIGNPDKYALTAQGNVNADMDDNGLTGLDALAIQIKLANG